MKTSKKQENLFNALPIVAAAYAEKIGVKINIGGHVAYTDGKSINLPNIPHDAPQKDAIWGYLAHEGAHVRFTDFSVQRTPGIHADLVNIIEDCRIEQLMIKAYPGTSATLLQTAEYMLQAGHYAGVNASSHPASILSGYMLYWLQAYGVGQPVLEALAESAERAFKQVFPMGAYVRMRILLNKCVACQSTQEAADLATQILKMIEEEEEQEKQQQQQQQSNDQTQSGSSDSTDDDDADDSSSNSKNASGDQGGNDQGSDGSDSQEQSSHQADDQGDSSAGSGEDGANNSAEQAQSQQQNAGDGPRSDSDQDEQQGQSTSNATGGSQGGKDQSDDKPSLSDQINTAAGDDLLGDAHDALKQELNQYAEPTSSGDAAYQHINQVTDVPAYGLVDLASEVKSLSAGIRQQLFGMVQASQRKADAQTRSGNRISANRLARVRAGETKVFNKPADKVMPNTAVHILVDMSGSMNQGLAGSSKAEYEIARDAALAIALALETIPGVNPAVSFFGPGLVKAGLRHGERVNAKRFNVHPGGSTPMAEALWFAGYELSKCKEQRKLVICITDGEPDRAQAVHDVLKLYKNADVESIGIGIGTGLVKTYFQNSIEIKAASDLRTTLFKLMQGSLLAA